MNLEGKVAIITGASSGIGRATAKLFAKKGAKIVAGARNSTELQQLIDEITDTGGQARYIAGDVQNEEFSKELVALADKDFGGLDIAFNNAGILGAMGPVEEVSLIGWTDTMNTNLTSAFLGAKYQIPALLKKGGGSMIFTSSFVGHTVGFPGMAAYSAAKAGVIGLMRTLAAEHGPAGIRINALLPGATDTPMAAELAADPDTLSYVKSIHALKRLATPEEIAQSALYLASDASSFMTGNALLVDGGVSIYKA
ncbi:MAG: SDR family oxidoreductase [Sneathiella sp.]